MSDNRFHQDDGRPRFVGPAVVVFPDGREAAVTASLVIRLDPATVPEFSYDRHSTWAGSLTLAVDDDVLLPQPLGIRAVLINRQVRPDELPLCMGELHSRHPRRSTRPGPAAKANLAD